MTRRFLIPAAALAMTMGGAAQAAFSPGVHPFGRFIGVGTPTVSHGTVASYEDFDVLTTSFVAFPAPGGPLFYEERYATAQTLSTVLLENNQRTITSGNIFIATSPGGPFNTLYSTISMGAYDTTIHGGVRNDVFGIRVEANTTTGLPSTGDHLQMAGADFMSINPGPNVAFGQTNISSANASITDSVTDHDIERAWRANLNTGANPEQFVGFEFAVPTALRGMRVIIAGPDGSQFGWRDFNVQIKRNGVWSTVGQANMLSTDNVFWGTFTNEFAPVEGVRLFGSTANGNNPGATEGGRIVNEIQVFGFLPEPASAGLMALGALAMLRRRR